MHDSAVQDDHKANLNALSNALEKQVRTWWDIFTMEQYVKDNIIVRSLRWEVTPQDGLDDTESMVEWLEFFYGVGFKLQELVLKRKKMAKLEHLINDLNTKLEPIKGTQQWTDFNSNINKKLDKVDKDTQKKKLKNIIAMLGTLKVG